MPGHLAIQLTWFAVAALIALVGFHRSTRSTLPVTAQAPEPEPGSDDYFLTSPRRTAGPSAPASDTKAP